MPEWRVSPDAAPGATTVSSCPAASAALPIRSRYERTPPPRSEKNSHRSKMRSEEGRFMKSSLVEGLGQIQEAARAPSWPARIGIVNDYVRVPHATGSSFASQ